MKQKLKIADSTSRLPGCAYMIIGSTMMKGSFLIR